MWPNSTLLPAGPQKECLSKGLRPGTVDDGKSVLPTAVLSIDESWELCRLPFDLADWVITAVAMAHSSANVFPTRVEFGSLDGRAFAEIALD